MSATAAPDLSLKMDPAFAYGEPGSLDAHPFSDGWSVWRHLSATVARDPLDLEAHVRRVRIARQLSVPGIVFAALVDTFLALGDKGLALRRRLLDATRDVLDSEEATYLERTIETGLTRGMDLPLGTPSVLDPGLMNSQPMVRHVRAVAAAMGVIEQANALLEQGDLAAARQLLEQSVLQDPHDTAVAQELLAIYRHSRDSQAEAAMREQLAARFGKAPAPWA